MMASHIDSVPVLEIMEKGNYDKFLQKMSIEYLSPYGHLTPKVSISVSSTNPHETTPRSFRTDSPEKLRSIIKHLIIGLHRLEVDRRLYKKGGNS